MCQGGEGVHCSAAYALAPYYCLPPHYKSYLCVCMCVCACVCVCASACVCVCVCILIRKMGSRENRSHTQLHTNTRTHTRTHARTYTHTPTHTHTHKHTPYDYVGAATTGQILSHFLTKYCRHRHSIFKNQHVGAGPQNWFSLRWTILVSFFVPDALHV